MIDKIIYAFCGWVDNLTDKVEEVFTFNFPKSKKRTKNVKSPDKRMDFPIE